MSRRLIQGHPGGMNELLFVKYNYSINADRNSTPPHELFKEFTTISGVFLAHSYNSDFSRLLTLLSIVMKTTNTSKMFLEANQIKLLSLLGLGLKQSF